MSNRRSLILATVFSIAMGYLEAAVVVYLRKLYYPEGFDFPLKPLPDLMGFTELGREAATLVMLLAIGLMLGKNKMERFAYFLFCFAVWDIVYYLGLKGILDWPASFFTWDILFLIPIPWTGPVIVPVAAALSMIFLSLVLITVSNKSSTPGLTVFHLAWLVSGAVVFILACIWDYSTYVISNNGWNALYTLDKKTLFSLTEHYIPNSFPWLIFGLSMALIWIGIGKFVWCNRRAFIAH